MRSRSNTNWRGIDIASYQEGLDFSLVQKAGIQMVYIKATQGLKYVNPFLKQHYKEAKAQGLLIGFYHYFVPNLNATEQAMHFINTIRDMAYELLPALDVEVTSGYSKRGLTEAVHECMNEIQYLSNHIPVLYTYTSFAKDDLVADGISQYPLWIADYNNRGYPGWNPIWNDWVGYQYSSEGDIGGVTVDMDEFTDDIFIGGAPMAEEWKIKIVARGLADGLLTEEHDPDEPVTVAMLLAIIYNGKLKGVI